MRRLLVLAVAVLSLFLLAGCRGTGSESPGAPPSATLIAMPDVVGQNAAVALDQLKKLGFTNVTLGTVDGHSMVVLPENWTVRTQSAQPGEQLAGNAKIVLGCARIGERHWLRPVAPS